MFKNKKRSVIQLSMLAIALLPLALKVYGLEYKGMLTPESSSAGMEDSLAAIQCKLWTEQTDKVGQAMVEWCGQIIDLPKISAKKQRITFHECKKKLKQSSTTAAHETAFVLHLAHDSDAFVHFCCFKPRDKTEEKLGDLDILSEGLPGAAVVGAGRRENGVS